MDDMAALRELEADTPAVSARALYRGRARLRREMAYERRPRAPRRVRLAPAAAVAVAIGVGVVLLTDGDEGAPPEPPVQLTSAAGALELAAQAAAGEATGPIPRRGQYLYRKDVTVEQRLDGTGPAKRYVDENWVSADPDGLTRNSELGNVWYTRGRSWPEFEQLQKLPTRPGQLLLAIRSWPEDGRRSSEPMSEEDYAAAYEHLAMLLYHDPPMPSLLRGAAFAAMARIPGVRIVDNEVDARNRHGVAISGPGPLGGQSLVLDASTHEYLGLRTTDVSSDGERVERVSTRAVSGLVDAIGRRPSRGSG